MVHYIISKGGIIVVEGTAEAMLYLRNFGLGVGDDLAGVWSQYDDANAVIDVATNSLQGNGLGAIKVLGAAAYGGVIVAGLSIGALPVAGAAVVLIASGYLAGKLYEWAFNHAVGIGERAGQAAYELWGDPGIDFTTNTLTSNALNWVPPRRDPLVLDLDGGGITTSGINPNAPILFDQDGDGILTATGWIASGEAIVVRDLNGNGTIDSGRELFGDNTILTTGARAGQTAANGFEALADLDSNADGKFDAADTAFSSVKLWRDTNQNGISEADELFSFASQGVASINTTGTASNVNLGGGNTQTHAGTFTKTGGALGNAGTAELAGSLLLANNNFYREFTDDPALTAAARALPQMQGSGLVRDLRPAMSLGNAQALALQAQLTQYAADTTKAQQLAHLDGVIQSWGATSAMQTSVLVNRMIAKITALEQFNGRGFATKRIAACARSTRARGRFLYETRDRDGHQLKSITAQALGNTDCVAPKINVTASSFSVSSQRKEISK